MLWGPVSDHVGRRPISAACLLILSLSCVGLALVPTSAFWLLMLLRCLQAAGSASTIAIGVCFELSAARLLAWIKYGAHGLFIGAGVVGDISTRAERGGFFGIFTLGPMVCTVSEQTLFTYVSPLTTPRYLGWSGDWACDRWSAGGPSWLARALLVFVHSRVNLFCDNYSVSNLIYVDGITLIFLYWIGSNQRH